MEGTHGELRAGLADGLRGDDADGLTELDQLVRRERQSVTSGAHALHGVTGERRANANAIDGGVFSKQLDVVDHQHGAGSDGRTVRERDIFGQDAAPQFGLEVRALAASVGRDVLDPHAALGVAVELLDD